MSYQEEIAAIAKRYAQLRSDETIKHVRAIQKLKTEEDAEIAAIHAKQGKPPGYKDPWKVRCEQFDIEFEMPSYGPPLAIPGIDYVLTDLSAGGRSFAQIGKIVRDRKLVLPEFFTWTITSPKGRTETWDPDRLYQETAMEVAAG